MRLNQRDLTLAALGAVAFLFGLMFLSDLVGYQLDGIFYVSPALRETRMPVFGLAFGGATALVYFYWRGYKVAAHVAVLALTGALPYVFIPQSFDVAVPQGLWIPFLMAVAICGLRWGLVVLAVSLALIVATFPNAYNAAPMIAASLAIAVLVILGRLVQCDLLRRAKAAQHEAEQSEAAVRESELKYRMLAEQSPLAIQVFAPDGSTLRVNRAWEALWGTSFSALRRYNLFKDKQLAELGILPLLAKAFEGECVQLPIHEYDKAAAAVVSQCGGKVWLRTFAYPLNGPDGTLREVVVLQENVTERILADEQIRNLAYFDPLTQLPNRRLLRDRLGQALIAGNRSREFGALLILDLDHFKTLNDSQGHGIGDLLLVEIAQRLTRTVRGEDTVSRLGGDEYVVVLEGLGPDEQTAASQAEQIAEKVRKAITRPYALEAGEIEYHPTSSIGLTLFRGLETPVETLLKQAEMALYQAKGSGRNAIRFFSPQMQAAIDVRIAMENALRLALERHEFRLFYQPQVDQSGGIIGVEALLRWQHPCQGLVTPDRFIPLSEETGLILPMGRWVIETACAQLKVWENDPRTRHLQVAVNVSARQFRQPGFVAQVRESIAASGANPKRLKLELTESMVLEDVENIISRMQQLDGLGVGFSLDDFGTGYSSLSYLKRLPFKQLKIDQSFVRDIDQDPNDAAIVRAILAMSQTLGIQAIAEGIETVGQRDFLRQNGCRAFQGFLFGKPVPVAELERWLTDYGTGDAGDESPRSS